MITEELRATGGERLVSTGEIGGSASLVVRDARGRRAPRFCDEMPGQAGSQMRGGR